MDKRNDITGMLELLSVPGFCVQNYVITALNTSAKGLLLSSGTDISTLLLTGSREYASFSGGCLYLTLSLGGESWGAAVTRMGDCDIFVLEQEEDQAELRSMALAARELREPLTNVMVTAERLFPMSAQNQDPHTKEQVARLNRGLYQILRILGNMSDACGRVSRQETCDISAVIQEITEKSASLMQHAGITLTYRGLSEPVYTLADREQLERALLNILSNAMKFTGAGGTVEVRLIQEGSLLSLSVLDSGSSIADGILQSLFRRYLRQPVIEDSRFGIGLGMVLIRNAASAHGGTVLVDQPGDTGTRVTMTLAIRHSHDVQLRSPILRVDYAGERDHGLLEFSETLPVFLYEKE